MLLCLAPDAPTRVPRRLAALAPTLPIAPATPTTAITGDTPAGEPTTFGELPQVLRARQSWFGSSRRTWNGIRRDDRVAAIGAHDSRPHHHAFADDERKAHVLAS